MGKAQRELADMLRGMGACLEALEWVEAYDLPTLEAYWCAVDYDDGAWLVWIATKVGVSTSHIRRTSGHEDCTVGRNVDDLRTLIPFASIEAALAARATEEKAP